MTGVEFAHALKPNDTISLSVRYEVPEIFRFAHFYYLRVKTGTLRESMRICLVTKEQVARALAYCESPTRAPDAPQPNLEINHLDDSVVLSWAVLYPECFSVMKTAWALTR